MALSSCNDLQLSIQGFIRPGEWCIGPRVIRRIRQKWICDNRPEEVYSSLITIFEEVLTEEDKKIMFSPRIILYKSSTINCHRSHSLTVHLITKLGWLDTLDIIIQSDNLGGSIIYFTLAATGVCTVTNPCSLTMNILCCLFPFASMIQTDRLKILKNVCDKKLKIIDVQDLCNI